MMRLSTMWRVDRTIDEAGRSPIAERLLAGWAHDPGTLRFHRSSANVLYRFERGGRPHLLRFADGEERSREAVASEVALLRWLLGEGVAVARPVPSEAGEEVATVDTGEGVFHAVVFEAAEGSHPDVEEMDEAGFHSWGAVVGRLHAVLATCPREIAGRRPELRGRVERVRAAAPDRFPAIRREADRLVAELDRIPAGPDTVGLVHLDLELDNLVWSEDGVTVIDFDDCARGPREADVAFALRDLFDAGPALDDRRVGAFLDGYGEHRRLGDEAVARLPLFSRLARLLNLGALTREVDLGQAPDQAAWLNGLVAHLTGLLAAYEASLVAGEP
jgi:Ser/Thr protein kinase RdoA (MazF antagonist)